VVDFPPDKLGFPPEGVAHKQSAQDRPITGVKLVGRDAGAHFVSRGYPDKNSVEPMLRLETFGDQPGGAVIPSDGDPGNGESMLPKAIGDRETERVRIVAPVKNGFDCREVSACDPPGPRVACGVPQPTIVSVIAVAASINDAAWSLAMGGRYTTQGSCAQ